MPATQLQQLRGSPWLFLFWVSLFYAKPEIETEDKQDGGYDDSDLYDDLDVYNEYPYISSYNETEIEDELDDDDELNGNDGKDYWDDGNGRHRN